MSLAYWMNSGWMWSCRREAQAFSMATHSVAKAQWAVLAEIISSNANSDFGQDHDFGAIRSVADFQQGVPLASHDDYADAIAKIADGQGNVLTCEAVELLEPTSGSTQAEKLIPYTASLRRQFQRAVAVWIADVMKHRPGVRRGRAYWSISPAMGTRRVSDGGIPIGFDNDAAYLSRLERYFLKYLLVMPTGVESLTSIENFRYCTLFHLLAASDLSLMSVWSPTFLTSLLSQIEPWADRLVDGLQRGYATPPIVEDDGMSDAILVRRCSAKRATEVRNILLSNDSISTKLCRLWPQLEMISCWADGTARNYTNCIREYFPEVAIQPKGLMSTEACVSFPLIDRVGAALAIRSHFFEFFPAASASVDGNSLLAHELNEGEQYQIVVTTGGGLYRYRLDDVVHVVGSLNECPLLRFVGRAGRVSDLVGEKLNESHVSQVLHRVFEAHKVVAQFAMIAPSREQPGYRLYLEADNIDRVQSRKGSISLDIEAGLYENPHYRYAVDLGQLHPLKTYIVDARQSQLWPIYERVQLERGQKAGDIKPAALDSWVGWHNEFEKEVGLELLME